MASDAVLVNRTRLIGTFAVLVTVLGLLSGCLRYVDTWAMAERSVENSLTIAVNRIAVRFSEIAFSGAPGDITPDMFAEVATSVTFGSDQPPTPWGREVIYDLETGTAATSLGVFLAASNRVDAGLNSASNHSYACGRLTANYETQTVRLDDEPCPPRIPVKALGNDQDDYQEISLSEAAQRIGGTVEW